MGLRKRGAGVVSLIVFGPLNRRRVDNDRCGAGTFVGMLLGLLTVERVCSGATRYRLHRELYAWVRDSAVTASLSPL